MLKGDISLKDAAKKRYALWIVARIRQNTLAGIGADGKPLAPYSSKTFARPMGGIPKNVRLTLDKAEKITYFRKKGRKTWIAIEGGYLVLKKTWYPEDGDKVNMTATGKMLRAMLGVVEGDTILIKFSREEEAEKAFWHNESGAGKSHIIRKFLGLPDKDWQESNELFTADDFQINITGEL